MLRTRKSLRSWGENDGDFVSLGFGGIIVVQFVDNLLVGDQDASDDLMVFELGADVEEVSVAIRPTPFTEMLLGARFDKDGDGFYEVGFASSSSPSLDIDILFGVLPEGPLTFDAVKLVDLDFNSSSSGTHGADIDAVQALSSIILGRHEQ